MKYKQVILIIILFSLISNCSFALSKQNINISQKFNTISNSKLNDLDISFTIFSDKSNYKWLSEPVHLTMEIKNNDENNFAILRFPTTQLYDIIIERKIGIKLYQWSESKTFHQEITEIIIFPGETAKWYFSWNQTGHYFKFMPIHPILPGRLRINAMLPLMDTEYQAECSIKIGLI